MTNTPELRKAAACAGAIVNKNVNITLSNYENVRFFIEGKLEPVLDGYGVQISTNTLWFCHIGCHDMNNTISFDATSILVGDGEDMLAKLWLAARDIIEGT